MLPTNTEASKDLRDCYENALAALVFKTAL